MIPALTLDRVSVPPGRITWIDLRMSGGDTLYAHLLVPTPDERQKYGVLTGFGRGEMALPKGKTVFFITYRQGNVESFLTMYADPELIEKHWEDFRKMLRNARRYESRRAAADPKLEAVTLPCSWQVAA